MKQPKLHHYVPQSYLKGFANEKGLVWVYDRDKNTYKELAPVKTCAEKYFYTIIDKNGKKDTKIETLFRDLEGLAIPVIKKVIAKGEITPEEKEYLAVFCSLMLFRVPDFTKFEMELFDKGAKLILQHVCRTEEKMKAIIEDLDRKTNRQYGVTPEQLHSAFKFIQQGDYRVESDKRYRLEGMVLHIFDFSRIFMQLEWKIGYAPPALSFITTDRPFILVPPLGNEGKPLQHYGILTKDVLKIIPLNSSTCLTMWNEGNAIYCKNVRETFIKDANRWLSYSCDRFLIGNSRELLESIVNETKIDKGKRTSRVEVTWQPANQGYSDPEISPD
jgi:hypothetical protein